jgi:hypothetical protein
LFLFTWLKWDIGRALANIFVISVWGRSNEENYLHHYHHRCATLAISASGGTGAANASPYVLTLDQVGSNVVATRSGEIDLTGLRPVEIQDSI